MSTLLFFVIIHQVFSRENRYKIEGHVEGADSREGTSKARRCLGPGTWMAGVQATGSLSCKHRTPTGKPAPSLPPVWGPAVARPGGTGPSQQLRQFRVCGAA